MKVLIVGGGLLGLSTAWHLNKHGADISLVERNDGAGEETSFANGGMLTPSMSDPWNAPGVLGQLIKWLGREDAPLLLRPHALPSLIGWGWTFLRNSSRERFLANTRKNAVLAGYSVEATRALRADTDIQYEAAELGTLKVFREPAALRSVAQLSGTLSDLGLRFTVLDREGVLAAEPALAPVAGNLIGGIHYGGDESGDAYLFCQRLQQLCASRGVTFHFDTTVRKFVTERGRIAAVITNDRQFEADAVVIAAGSYSAPLLRPLGIRLPVRPAKGYSLTLPLGSWNGPRLPVVDDHLHAAVTPLGNRIRVAGTAEFAGFDSVINQGRIDNLSRMLKGIYPEFASGLAAGAGVPWTGFRPMSADGVPLIGATRIDNLFVNTGHGHLGWTMAVGSGKLLADLVAGKQPDIAADPYDPRRFSFTQGRTT